MQKMTKICMYFIKETDIVGNLITDFFLTLTVRGLFHRHNFKGKNMGVWGYFLKKTEALYAELNKRAEAATNNFSAAGKFLQYIYSVFVAKNHHKI